MDTKYNCESSLYAKYNSENALKLMDQLLGFTTEMKFSTMEFGAFCKSHFEALFNKDLKVSEPSFGQIGLYFNRQGKCLYKMDGYGREMIFLPDTYNIGFVQEGNIGSGRYSMNNHLIMETIHVSPDSFGRMASNYPEVFNKLYKRYMLGESFAFYDQNRPITAQMKVILSQIEQSETLGNVSDIYAESKVLELMALVFEDSQKESADFRKHKRIKLTAQDISRVHDTGEYLRANFTEAPSLTELAKIAGINEYKLKNGFRDIFGKTVYGFLFEERMKKAEEYLLNTDDTIYEVALKCGYEYPSHFSTAFKRYFKISPRQLRDSE